MVLTFGQVDSYYMILMFLLSEMIHKYNKVQSQNNVCLNKYNKNQISTNKLKTRICL